MALNPSPLDAILKPVDNLMPHEKVFDSLGMMQGTYSPIFRGLTIAGLSGVALYALRPSIWFDPNGRPRPWTYTSNSEDAVVVPWWIVPAAGFAIGGLFI